VAVRFGVHRPTAIEKCVRRSSREEARGYRLLPPPFGKKEVS
jgi:hypothetical protein